jgi:hypothetical protein
LNQGELHDLHRGKPRSGQAFELRDRHELHGQTDDYGALRPPQSGERVARDARDAHYTIMNQ